MYVCMCFTDMVAPGSCRQKSTGDSSVSSEENRRLEQRGIIPVVSAAQTLVDLA